MKMAFYDTGNDMKLGGYFDFCVDKEGDMYVVIEDTKGGKAQIPLDVYATMNDYFSHEWYEMRVQDLGVYPAKVEQ